MEKSIIERLIDAVEAQGPSYGKMVDAANNGGNGGYSGFIYYTETKAFYDEHTKLIWEHVREDADCMGVSISEYFGSFRDEEVLEALPVMAYAHLGDLTDDEECLVSTFTNTMATHALESAGRHIEMVREEDPTQFEDEDYWPIEEGEDNEPS